jgi:hypothetical protein
MSNNSSRTKPIVVGYVIVFVMFVGLFSAALWSLQRFELPMHELQTETQNAVLLEKVSQYPIQLSLTIQHYRDTNDKKLIEQFQEQCESAIQLIQEIQPKQRIAMMQELMVVEQHLLSQLSNLFVDDVNISERLANEESEKLQADRLHIRKQQDQIIADMEKVSIELVENQKNMLDSNYIQYMRLGQNIRIILIVISTLVLIIHTLVLFVVIRLVNRSPSPSDWEDAGTVPSGGSQDIRLVADRLQEVVDLMRRT